MARGLGVRRVHPLSNGDAPVRVGHREDDVGGHRAQRRGGVGRAEAERDDGRHERDLQRRRRDVEERHRHEVVDGPRAAVDDAAQLPRLAVQVEGEVQRRQVLVDAPRDDADRALRHRREDVVPQLLEAAVAEARDAVAQEARRRRRRGERRGPVQRAGAGDRAEAVDGLLEEERGRDRHALGADEQRRAAGDAPLDRRRLVVRRRRADGVLPVAVAARGPELGFQET